jgi:hypothetical protein
MGLCPVCVVVRRQYLGRLHSSRHSFNGIIIKLCQNVYLYEVQVKFEYGSSKVKN